MKPLNIIEIIQRTRNLIFLLTRMKNKLNITHSIDTCILEKDKYDG